jgi:hypothetical protein
MAEREVRNQAWSNAGPADGLENIRIAMAGPPLAVGTDH